MRFVLVFMALWAVVTAAHAETRMITVTGQGVTEFVPDMAVITLGVSHQHETAREAVADVAVTSGAMLTGLGNLGVAPRDMQTSNLSLSQIWDHSSPGNPAKVIGYEANNQVTVRVKDLAVLGEILGHVTAEGANRFQGLHFALQNPQPQVDEARRRAVADGKARAQLYADAAGVVLGELIEIRDAGPDAPRPMAMARESFVADMVMPIAKGELTVSASVILRFAIVDE